ncbi:hypothetical protein, partial [Agrobacterium sp.]|uniref:hypothetical protein n=1 Tax=Agrobacterium sp. TaxID=361 RepID=UPI0028AACC4F
DTQPHKAAKATRTGQVYTLIRNQLSAYNDDRPLNADVAKLSALMGSTSVLAPEIFS